MHMGKDYLLKIAYAGNAMSVENIELMSSMQRNFTHTRKLETPKRRLSKCYCDIA